MLPANPCLASDFGHLLDSVCDENLPRFSRIFDPVQSDHTVHPYRCGNDEWAIVSGRGIDFGPCLLPSAHSPILVKRFLILTSVDLCSRAFDYSMRCCLRQQILEDEQLVLDLLLLLCFLELSQFSTGYTI